MSRYRFLLEHTNLNFFDIPHGKFKSFWTSKKFGFLSSKLEDHSANIFVVNKSTKFDALFVQNYFNVPFVFLKQETLACIDDGTLKKQEEKKLLDAFKTLAENNISVVVFPERNLTVFGEVAKISINITDFLTKLKMTIKFLTIHGPFFELPVWAKKQNKCEAKFILHSIIKPEKIHGSDSTYINALFNDSMPSSASTYARKFPINITTKTRAEGLEKVVYCCPKCKELFSIYSEFNCIKCSNCGTALEIDENGLIALFNGIEDFDDLSKFQFNELKKLKNLKKPLIQYHNINLLQLSFEDKHKLESKVNVEIFVNKLVYGEKIIKFTEIYDAYLLPDNILKITLKNGTIFGLQGETNENLYILVDLLRIK
ncbi:MAG: hypothetical protein IJ538_01885 [Clostridia bacterium]|nr:hypothetical protein [Clostridia bacterium]